MKTERELAFILDIVKKKLWNLYIDNKTNKYRKTYDESSSEANFLALDQQSPAMKASIASFIISAHTNTLAANKYSSYSIKRGPVKNIKSFLMGQSVCSKNYELIFSKSFSCLEKQISSA